MRVLGSVWVSLDYSFNLNSTLSTVVTLASGPRLVNKKVVQFPTPVEMRFGLLPYTSKSKYLQKCYSDFPSLSFIGVDVSPSFLSSSSTVFPQYRFVLGFVYVSKRQKRVGVHHLLFTEVHVRDVNDLYTPLKRVR